MDDPTSRRRLLLLPRSLVSPTGRERSAVFAMFALDGAGFGVWAAYLPTYKQALGLSDAQLAWGLFAVVVGSLLSMPTTGRWLLSRCSRTILLAGAGAFCLTIPLTALAGTSLANGWAFLLAAFLFGGAKGIIDVSANAHAIGVERDGAGPLLSTCHGGWSLGVLFGSAAVALALKGNIPPLAAASSIAGALLGLTLWSSRHLHETPPQPTPGVGPRSVWPTGRLVPLAALAFVGLFCEGSMGDWGAIFLTDVVRASSSAAALGLSAYSLVMMFGRFFGDRLVARLGAEGALRASGLGVALGLGLAIVFRTYPAALIGFAVVGLGVSNMVPILFRAAGRDGDSGAAIASVSTVGYLGFLIGPPLIGAVSHSAGLSTALVIVIVFGLTVAAGSRFVGDRSVWSIKASKSFEESSHHGCCESTV